jgi:opacity protein-like surface antigen
MKKHLVLRACLCLILALVAFLTTDSYAQKIKIRVVVDNANVRLKPDLQGEIIRNPPLGSSFEVESREGDWYEIRVRTEMGVLITGYIHNSFVQVQGEETTPPEQETRQAPVQTYDQPQTRDERPKRAELVFRMGYVTGYNLSGSYSYSESFSAGILESASTSGKITTEYKSPLGFDGALNFFIAKGIGIQVKFDYNSTVKSNEASRSTYDINWTWSSGGSYSRENEWSVESEVSSYILSGNLLYKIPTGSMVEPLISGGVSYFSGSASVDTTVGYASTWESEGFRYIDYFALPASVEASLSGIGFNVGGGIDFVFTRGVALNIDGRYFSRGKIEVPWQVQGGTYPSNINEGWTITVTEENANEFASQIEPYSINPSFFKVSAGIKIMF